MRRKRILIWTFPLTFLAAGILISAIIFLSQDEPEPFIFVDEPDAGPSSMQMFVYGVIVFAVMGAGSFVSHVPVALALNKRLPADRLWLMILLSLAAIVATFFLWSLILLTIDLHERPLLWLLIMVLLPGMVMSLIHVLVAFVPCSFLNRSNSPKTT